ncbi:hypothetical protein OG500_08135 [Kitasatospora sp. NBC_01250]|uniref:hypothetical protein n=1 Tax=unclassified Kitasatospora TaxID=2633591 RepID=UPI002E106BC6|nr:MULTISPECIES: hypothetical protein [unclassified Kitasatospora]WSJ66070.1 hypothetical protein OG294_08055 [Kitasatospora sp. NBC_01302]
MLTGAICYALTVAGLALAATHGLRRRWRTATRWAGLALLPAGVYLTGLVPVGTAIGRAVGHWATRLVFDPRVWTGVGLLGLAVLLLVLSRLGAAGGSGRTEAPADAVGRGESRSREGRAAPAAAAPPAVDPAPKGKKSAADELGDFSDIEEILRKRGI